MLKEISCGAMELDNSLNTPIFSGFHARTRQRLEFQVIFWAEMVVTVNIYQI
jgi:hypothetical protein